MPHDLLIRSVLFGGMVRNVAISEGKIVSLNAEGTALHEIDAKGELELWPGIIDSHVHFNEPGRADWEGFASGSSAFVAGGGTLFFDMPLNANPPTNTPEAFRLKLEAAQKSSVADFALWGGVTPSNLDQIEALAECGVVGFKAFFSPSGIEEFDHVSADVLEKAMNLVARTGLPLALHAEDPALLGEGSGGWRQFADSRPIKAEISAVRIAIDLAAATHCDTHIVHVTAPEVLQMIAAARANGVRVTSEVCAHHLLLDETVMETLGSLGKCAPPLRPKQTVEKLWDHIELATMFGSDHSPAPAAMKEKKPFAQAWGGISGVQHTFPLLLHEFLHRGLDPLLLTRRLGENIASRFHVPGKGTIAVGSDADFCLVDPNGNQTITEESLLDRHRHSPYIGRMCRPVVNHTFRRGELVYSLGKIRATTTGKLIRPQL